MENAITFNKTGYDPLIDFIKAYAILCVLIGHTLPYHNYWGYGLWAGMQVPLFVLVQTFHCFKKESPSFSIKKALWRIIVPYLIIQSVLFCVLFLKEEKQDTLSLLIYFMKGGGIGPGSYYPWIYLQIAVLLPFFRKWMDLKTKIQLTIIFIVICESMEIVVSVIDLPDSLYRLLAIRYFFLFYLGWIWVKEGIVIDTKMILISLISFLSIIYFEYISVNDEIFFYNTAWKYHRWPCYYFVAMGGVVLLKLLYDKLSKSTTVLHCIILLARCSYEIFLVQMLIIPIFPNNWLEEILQNAGMGNFDIWIIILMTKIVVIFVASIVIGYYFNLNYNKVVGKYIRK